MTLFQSTNRESEQKKGTAKEKKRMKEQENEEKNEKIEREKWGKK
jgi:hypothetical protein